MLNTLQYITFSYAALFPVINPIGSSVIVLSVLNGSPPSELNKLAYKISIYTAVMLIVMLVTGSWILRIFGITIPVVLIGGGLVLAYLGWQLLNQPDQEEKQDAAEEAVQQTTDYNAMVFYPLTMPITAGPGCIAIAIAIGAHGIATSWQATLLNEIGNTIGILLVCLTVYFCYRYSHIILKRIGKSGTVIIMRMAAFFNLCIGLELIWRGVQYLLKS